MKLANRLLAPVNTTVISILGIGQFIMGLWVSLPFNSLYDYQLFPLPELLIGLTLMLIGGLTGLFSIKTNLKGLQAATTFGYIFWFVSAVVMFISNFASPGWIVGLIFAVYCLMINVNIRVNRRYLI